MQPQIASNAAIVTDKNVIITKTQTIGRQLLPAWFAVALFICNPGHAQDKSAEIDKMFSWATPATPGCVCAIAQEGKVIFNKAYGLADLEREVPLTTNSVFDAASITKQFVAAAVLIMVEEKSLSLEDDVHKYIPELPDYGHKITIDHLLTHTSGLRDWPGIASISATNADALSLVLRQRGLDFAPGEEWAYSNSGYVLLKEIIARKTGQSFSEFAKTRLFGPLGMKLTAYQDDLREIIKNRALAYDNSGNKWKLDMALGNERGGGGALLTTASDLLIWNEALTNNRLGAFVTNKLQEAAQLNNGRKLGYARGLYLNTNRGGKVIWHTGGSSGYGAILARFPAQQLSVAIMCNSGDAGDRTSFTRRIFDLYVPVSEQKTGTQKIDSNKASVAIAPTDVSKKAGLFFNEANGEAMVLIAAPKGSLRVARGPLLDQVSANRFRNPTGVLGFMSGDEFELEFTSDERFELKTMEGKKMKFRRARAYLPAAVELDALTGRYESDETSTIFRITKKEKGLTLTLEHATQKSLEFKPVDPDTFQAGGMIIRFRRDNAGKIIGLDYSNPVLRKVYFERLINKAAKS